MIRHVAQWADQSLQHATEFFKQILCSLNTILLHSLLIPSTIEPFILLTGTIMNLISLHNHHFSFFSDTKVVLIPFVELTLCTSYEPCSTDPYTKDCKSPPIYISVSLTYLLVNWSHAICLALCTLQFYQTCTNAECRASTFYSCLKKIFKWRVGYGNWS